MKRRASERGISTENLASKQRRIVRRKRPSPSPELETHTPKSREIRTTSSGLYTSKYNATKYEQSQQHGSSKYATNDHESSSKYAKFDRHSGSGGKKGSSGGDIHDERMSSKSGFVEKSSKYGEYPIHHHGNDHVTTSSRGSGTKSALQPGHYYEYSLRVGNIDFNLPDKEVKKSLISKFTRFGYLNIKVVGSGKDRHGFINFQLEEDARTAREKMHKTMFHGRPLEVSWSRTTLNRFPELLTGKNHHEPRSPVMSVKKRLLSSNVDDLPPPPPPPPQAFDSFGGIHEREHATEHYTTSQSSRDISYRSSVGSPPSSASHDRTRPSNDSSTSSKVVLDPNATRTLFVGNLEMDITERELRDLFSPYGRIESVDIKTQRSNNTAYAFVKFLVINDAMNAKKDMHERQYGDLRLKIGFGKGSPSIKVWIGNITSYADVSEIRKELDRFGLIRKVEYAPGDAHAIAHFDSTEAAEAAASSLSKFRFRSTKKLLKIDIIKTPSSNSHSEFEDFDLDFQSSSLSSESHTPNWTRSLSTSGGGGQTAYNKPRIPRQQSNGHRPSYTSSGGSKSMSGRIVSENDEVVIRSRLDERGQQPPSDTYNEKYDRNNTTYRKRHRSPDVPFDNIRDGGGSFRGQHSSGDNVGSFNGDLHHRPKRSRSNFDAYQYHKLYGQRTAERERPGSVSGGGALSTYRGNRGGGDSFADRDREKRGGRGERERQNGYSNRHVSPPSHSSRGGDRHRRARSSEMGGGRTKGERSSSTSTNQGGESEPGKRRGKDDDVVPAPPPPPPPAPPTIDMISNDTADTALKLGDSTGPSSPNGSSKSGDKPDLATLTPESFGDLAKLYPIAWKGNLVLKNTGFPTRMHLIGGDPAVAEMLARNKDGKDDFSSLRITQRLRLEPPRLEEVNKRVASAGPSGHCVLLALPGPTPNHTSSSSPDSLTTSMQLRPLRSLVSYLKQKEAAGIVALNVVSEKGASDSTSTAATNGALSDIIDKDLSGVLHAFPPCEFSLNQLLKIVPNLGDEPPKEDHIVVLLVKGTV